MKKAELSLETAKEMYKSGGVAKDFALDNYTEKELTTREVKCWKDLDDVDGWFVNDDCVVLHCKDYTLEDCRNIFATKEQAEAAIAMAMLSQLMKDVNGDWKPDWSNSDQRKCVLYFTDERIEGHLIFSTRRFLAFPTEEIRDKFLDNHRELITKAKPLL